MTLVQWSLGTFYTLCIRPVWLSRTRKCALDEDATDFAGVWSGDIEMDTNWLTIEDYFAVQVNILSTKNGLIHMVEYTVINSQTFSPTAFKIEPLSKKGNNDKEASKPSNYLLKMRQAYWRVDHPPAS